MNHGHPTWSTDEIDVQRNRPLEKVAAALDYRPGPSDRTRRKRDRSVLCISGTRFFDHRQGCGCAIDLVMHAGKCPFLDATSFLAQSQGRSPAIEVWSGTRSWLVRQRALPPDLVDTCCAHNLIGAGRRNNVVFVCTDRHRKVTGAELAGTFTPPGHKPFRAMAPGSRKARGSFWLATDPQAIPHRRRHLLPCLSTPSTSPNAANPEPSSPPRAVSPSNSQTGSGA